MMQSLQTTLEPLSLPQTSLFRHHDLKQSPNSRRYRNIWLVKFSGYSLGVIRPTSWPMSQSKPVGLIIFQTIPINKGVLSVNYGRGKCMNQCQCIFLKWKQFKGKVRLAVIRNIIFFMQK